MKNKTLFLIPGFKQKTSDAGFVWLTRFLKSKGFEIVGVSIKWDRRKMADYINDFKKIYARHKAKINYVLGFSYGAVIALMTADELKPSKIYLCSLSPDFQEDVRAMKPWIRKLVGKKRLVDIRKRSAKQIARRLKIPSVIFYGETEGRQYPQLKKRCEETSILARNSKLVIVKHAPHKINHPAYVEAIKSEFNHEFR